MSNQTDTVERYQGVVVLLTIGLVLLLAQPVYNWFYEAGVNKVEAEYYEKAYNRCIDNKEVK